MTNAPAHRSISYSSTNATSREIGNKRYGNDNYQRPRRPLRVYVGDMVKVTDPRCELMGKYGLVEQVCPKNREWQVMVKIGQYSNRLMFRQIRFCTRLNRNSDDDARDDEGNQCNAATPEEQSRINEYIDPVGVEDEDDQNDNRGNQ